MTDQTLSPLLQFNDGNTIPQLGLGVYKISDDETAAVVRTALEVGYRHVDTAAFYGNEASVGRGVAESGLPRHEVFVTTKVWNHDHGYDNTLRAFDASLSTLGFDYIDLYLIHWPQPALGLYVETWRALEALKASGRARSIGVSNFEPHHLERLASETDIVPAINQVELHPMLTQQDVRAYDAAHGILTEAWAPLARGRIVDQPVIQRLAAAHGKTAAQVVIRWHLQLGNVVIPKSVTPARVAANFDVWHFTLTDDEVAAISAIDSDTRTGMHPDENG
jgi:2,5-diketo-D-gluconate reductase A